jgi:hypothetical protein
LRDAALSLHIPPSMQTLQGVRLLDDAPRGCGPVLATVRSIVRSNPRMGPMDALHLAVLTSAAAHRAGLDVFFFAALLLQESAYAPDAMSSAGAVGIAQFTIPTADLLGVDPFEPRSSIDGAARLIARYLREYRDRDDPYELALAAYNAGPQSVAYYHGVPPYAETREYIVDVRERWALLVTDATPGFTSRESVAFGLRPIRLFKRNAFRGTPARGPTRRRFRVRQRYHDLRERTSGRHWDRFARRSVCRPRRVAFGSA